MNEPTNTEDQKERQLEIVELLDERFRLREDPSRMLELEGTHARLRERLHRSHRTETSPKN